MSAIDHRADAPQTNVAPRARAQVEDVVNCYRVFLGREPESREVIDCKLGMDLDELVEAFVSSIEFTEDMAATLLQGGLPADRFQAPLTLKARVWLTRTAPLTPASVDTILASGGWAEFLAAIYTDPHFQTAYPGLADLAPRAHRGGRLLQTGDEEAIRLSSEPCDLEAWRTLAIATGLFDPADYRRRVVALAPDADPLDHYLTQGYRYYFSPGPLFDEIAFMAQHPAARAVRKPGLVQFAHLPPSEQAAFLARRALVPESPPSAYWREAGVSLPDALVHEQRLRAVDFFNRFGFLFEGREELDRLDQAVGELAASSPTFESASRARPDVSIIIPIYGQLPYVVGCLDSLKRQVTRRTVEVIVYDDASPDEEAAALLQTIPWIRVVRGARNFGFLGACNAAARLAKGHHLVLLNSDVRICGRWLDELLDTFDTRPQAGLVGSKLFNADGSLQEAGGIIWADGGGWNYGRDDDPSRPTYSYARQVDYCSGAAIALPAALWRELNGFDTRYYPAYYDDTDLAFRVREAGREVWFQPLARAIHYEGKTNGRDLTSGTKAYQVRNQETFLKRWGHVLAGHGRPDGGSMVRSADRVRTNRVLVLDATMLFPDQDSGSITTLTMIKVMQSLGWSITFAGLHNLGYDEVYAAALNRLGVETLCWPHVHSVDDIIAQNPDGFDCILAFRHTVLHPIYAALRAAYPGAPIVFHNMDMHYLRLEREAALTGDRRILSLAEDAHDAETFLTLVADCTVVTSHMEAEHIRAELPEARPVVYPYTMDVRPASAPWGERPNVLFFGGYRHTPNVDAAGFLATEIWPVLAQRLPPTAKLVLAGSEMPASVRQLASERIECLGHVADLRPLLEQARAFVAPLRYGAGVKGKLVMALANGLPSVCSAITIEGMELIAEREILVADNVDAYVQSILQLYENEERWTSLQNAGYAFVRQTYCWDRSVRTCQDILARADEAWRAGRRRRRAEMVEQIRSVLD